jgi:S1-C subfamily serine protease
MLCQNRKTMFLSCALFVGLSILLLGSPADPAPARFVFSAVSPGGNLSSADSRAAVRSDSEGATAENVFPQLRTPQIRRLIDTAVMAAQNQQGRAAPEAKGPDSDDASRGWLGVRVQDITEEIAVGLGMKASVGALVGGVMPGSPAGYAGLRRGDVILKVDGEDVVTARAFAVTIARTPPGKTIGLLISRRGAQQSVTIQLGLSPKAMAWPAGELPKRSDDIGLNALLGISVELLSDEARSGHGIADYVSGVVITQVQPGQTLLKARDVVVEVDQEAVRTPDQLVRRVNAVRRSGRKTVVLTISDRHGDTRFVATPFSAAVVPAAKGDQTRRGQGEPLGELPEIERLERLR